jgi:hypothetical protein
MRFALAHRLIVSLQHIFLTGLLIAACFTAPVQAGWQKDEVCQGSCGGSCGPCPDSTGGGGSPVAGASQALQMETAGQAGYAIGTYLRESGEAADQKAALERQRRAEQQAVADRQVSEVARQREIERRRLFGENKDKILQQLGGESSAEADEAARERWLSRMCQSDMTQRRAGLAALKGSPDETWCKLNLIHVRCPTRPLNDVAGQYPDMVERYIDWKTTWDKRCGGPSAAPGYRGFDAELRSTERPPRPSAGSSTAQLPTMTPASAPVSAASPSERPAPPPVLVKVGSEQLALKDDDVPPVPLRHSVPVTPFEQNKAALGSDPAPSSDSSAAFEPAAHSVPVNVPATAMTATPASSGSPALNAPAAKAARQAPPSVSGSAKPSKDSASVAAAAARKVFDCAAKSFFAAAQDPSFETDVRSEMRRALTQLADSPPSGRAGVQTGYTISRDKQVHSKAGDAQAIFEATFQRVEAKGEWRVDIQYALIRPGADSLEGQTIVAIDADGRIIPADAASGTKTCLGL